ncbi:sigma-70 family RNA polymerase sigma factor [Puteibacter caeruleilacunae]|nr:sigma-70 family RNA polymerase sigma factor [Puteibacter caeruleilacunae]
MSISDQHIKKAFRWNTNEGFRLLNEKYYVVMCVRGCAILPDLETVKDLVQDVFMNLYEKGTYSKIDNYENYLYRAVKFKCINTIQRTQETHSLDQIDLIEEFESLNDNRIIPLQDKIKELPNSCREILLDKVYSEMSYIEIAKEKGVSVNTVKTQLRRAYSALKESSALFFSTLF